MTDNLAFMDQRRSRPAPTAKPLVLADENTFRATDGRHIQQPTNVARDTEPARMRQSMAVNHHHVGRAPQFPETFQQNRRLAKRQQPRHIRKPRPINNRRRLNE